MANNATGLIRIVKAAGYSWQGLRAAWQHEAAFRQEALAALAAIIIAGSHTWQIMPPDLSE
ncbi:diacylglycerol kinase [Pantoea sp. M_5]|uniref:diacylglycerol kinase n=1 Tax=Pantoea sp. M_5 TaxID=2608038 RepID=UPI00351BB672